MAGYIIKGLKKNNMLIGGWVSPPNISYCGKDFITKEHFQNIKDSGLNTIYTIYKPETDFKDIVKAADIAKDVGILLMIGDDRLGKEIKDEVSIIEFIEFCKSHSAICGINAYDEPGSNKYDIIAKNYNRFKPYLGDLLFYINHMPIYATASQLDGGWWTPEESEASNNNYEKHLDVFLEKVGAKVLSFDFYPFRLEKGLTDFRYFDQLSISLKVAKKYNVPLWNFIQITSWNHDVVRNATYSEILWQVSTALCYGVTGIQYFCYWTPCDSNGEFFLNAMIDRKGSKKKSYYFVKEVNKHLQAVSDYFMEAKHVGVIPYGNTLAKIPKCDCLSTFGNLKHIEADSLLIGCFIYKEKNMYYIVNTSVTESRFIKLDFNSKIKFKRIRGENITELNTDLFEGVLYEGEGILLLED